MAWWYAVVEYETGPQGGLFSKNNMSWSVWSLSSKLPIYILHCTFYLFMFDAPMITYIITAITGNTLKKKKILKKKIAACHFTEKSQNLLSWRLLKALTLETPSKWKQIKRKPHYINYCTRFLCGYVKCFPYKFL